MPDMLVRLYDMPPICSEGGLADEGIAIKQALANDKTRILEFVRTNFGNGWADECEKSIFNQPPSCYIAVKDREVLGFACYDATALGFFGPTGVAEHARGKGIGSVLLGKCLISMKEKGYGYAIIGYVTDALDFYKKAANAEPIEGADPEKSVFINLIDK
jgi:GNAT superfamily N-acetyltransferase